MVDMGLCCRAASGRVGVMQNTSAGKGLGSVVSTLIVCESCYVAANVCTSAPTDAQRDAADAMIAKVGYYNRGGQQFYTARNDEEATCQICFHDVDSYTVLWGSPDN